MTAPDTDINILPFLTAKTAGIGGLIKTRPDDYIVEELFAHVDKLWIGWIIDSYANEVI